MASTEEVISVPVEHSTPKQPPKTFGKEHEECQDRKSLQTLQQSALDDKTYVGVGLTQTKQSKPTEKTKFKPSRGHVKVFQDSDTMQSISNMHKAPATESKMTQTDDSLLEALIQERLQERGKRDHSFVEAEENEAYELMVKEPVPESYWKEVAEQRRLALNDTLEENSSLHQSMESLKEENEKLLELASQAEHLSSFLQSVVSEEEDEDNAQNEGTERPEQNDGDTALEGDIDTQATSPTQPQDNSTEICAPETEGSESNDGELTDGASDKAGDKS